MKIKRMTCVAMAWLTLFVGAAFFPRIATWISDTVPMAHLLFAPFGNTFVSTTVFTMVVGWILLTRLTPGMIDSSARSVARAAAMLIGIAWTAYVVFWLLLYWRSGL